MAEPERYGKWEVIKSISRGGQGQVYLVRDASGVPNTGEQWKTFKRAIETLNAGLEELHYEQAASELAEEIRRIASESQATQGALKKLLPIEEGAAEDEAAALERMKRELSTLESVDHPALVKVLDSNLDEEWFVMEFIEGGTLSNRLEKYKGRALDALAAFRPVVDAAVALHARKVVHRDIKPDNIFVASDGHLVLGDCGLAFGIEHETRQTRPFENVGSRDFQPPWSYTTRLAEVHPTFDVFCLAKVLWAMVSGRPTFRLWYFDEDGNDLREMFPDDPAMEFVKKILRKCVVEREREMKVHDARELLAEVDTAIAALSHGCELPGRERIMRCRFCGIGTYETLEGHLVAGGLLRTEYERTYVVCDHCGHVETFAWSEGKPPAVWDVSE